VSRQSDNSLYRTDLSSFTMDDSYDQKDAEGFIRILGLPSRSRARARAEAAKSEAPKSEGARERGVRDVSASRSMLISSAGSGPSNSTTACWGKSWRPAAPTRARSRMREY